MKQLRKFIVGGAALGLATSLVGGCDWRVYDDLKDDLWVSTQGKPSGIDSSRYGSSVVGLPSMSGDGAVVAVVGTTRPTVSGLSFDATGAITPLRVAGAEGWRGEVIPGPDFDFGVTQAIAREPGGDRVVLGLVTHELSSAGVADNFMAVTMRAGRDVSGNSVWEVLKRYEPERIDDPISGAEPIQDITFAGANNLFAARSDRLMLVDEASASNAELTGCHLPAGEGAIAVGFAEIGEFIDPATSLAYPDVVPGGDLIVVTAPVDSLGVPSGLGRLWVVAGGFNINTDGADCVMAEGSEIPGVVVSDGSRLLISDLGDTNAGLRMIVTAPGGDGSIRIYNPADGAAPPRVLDIPNLASLTVADLDQDGAFEIIAGQPTYDAGGVTRAGQVSFFSSETLAVSMPPIFDADPVAEQRFGQSVSTAPFTVGGVTQDILVVGAPGTAEVFTYFRSSFYPDVRTGRE